ncbi:MAG: endospore germination permease [Alicyclobacillus sp.]|nr:endospore germination permease [Alicyclobacillus sp.]
MGNATSRPAVNATSRPVTISALQFYIVVIASTTAFGHFVFIHLALMKAGRDTWVALLVACALGGLNAWFALWQAGRAPGQSFAMFVQSALGPWLGSLVGALYIAYFLVVAALTMKVLTDFLSIMYPTTPPGIFVFSVLFVAGWGCYKGLEVITRTMQVILPVLIAMGVAASLLSLKDKDVSRLMPVLQNGWPSVWGAALVFLAMFAEMVVFLNVTNHVNQPAQLHRLSLAWIGVTALMFLGPATGPVMMFGEQVARTLAFPTYSEIQYLHIRNVVERLDLMGILLWGFGSFFLVAVYLFGASKWTAELVGVDENLFVLPLAVCAGAITLGLGQASREDAYAFLGGTYVYIAIAMGIVLPLLVSAVAWMRKTVSLSPVGGAAGNGGPGSAFGGSMNTTGGQGGSVGSAGGQTQGQRPTDQGTQDGGQGSGAHGPSMDASRDSAPDPHADATRPPGQGPTRASSHPSDTDAEQRLLHSGVKIRRRVRAKPSQ